MHSGDQHCISSEKKVSVTKSVKMASSSNTKSISKNKFQLANNDFCGGRRNLSGKLQLYLVFSLVFISSILSKGK